MTQQASTGLAGTEKNVISWFHVDSPDEQQQIERSKTAGATKQLIVFIAVLLLITASGRAQIGGNGSIQGVVSDPSGAAVPNAAAVATNVSTGVRTSRTTTNAGYYVLSPLPAGEYKVTVTAPGFETITQEHVTVDALAQVALNLTLRVGSASQQVTVTAAPPLLNANDASMGQTMRNEIYAALLLAMGNTPRTAAFGIQNPSSYNIDVNLRRDFAIYESLKLTFQADAFNVLNLVTFSAPSTNISSSSFGKITSQSNGPRILQLSARITF